MEGGYGIEGDEWFSVGEALNLVIPRSLLRGRALYKKGVWKKGRTEAG